MALVNVPHMLWPNKYVFGTPNTLLIDAADENVGGIYESPEAGDISAVVVSLATVTTGATVDVRLETVDAATGLSTGTLFGTTTNGSAVIAGTDDNLTKEVALTANATVAKTNRIAAMVVNPSASFGNMQLRTANADLLANGLPYSENVAGTTHGNAFAAAFKFTTGTQYRTLGGAPPFASELITVLTNAASTEAGLDFKLPFKARIIGLSWFSDMDGDATIRLLDTSSAYGATLATINFDKNINSTVSDATHNFYFDTAVELTAGTEYRISFDPTESTNIRVETFVVSDANLRDCWYGDRNSSYTEWNGTAWSNTTTRVPKIGLILDQIDDGAGAGGGGQGVSQSLHGIEMGIAA